MRWDEEAYGREYDLDRFMIYAADDFNMGAMENKGLNIFNSRFLLADRDTATDADFQTVDAMSPHEYFHNWSGNRVTCRDWFQLAQGGLHGLSRTTVHGNPRLPGGDAHRRDGVHAVTPVRAGRGADGASDPPR
jgi:hypothetical protein